MRPIYLSKSAIEDFLSCRKRYYYRVFHADESEKTDEMTLGNVIHLALEKSWDNKPNAEKLAMSAMSEFSLPSKYTDTVLEMLDNYFTNFKMLTTGKDEVEYNFKVPYHDAVVDNVYLVGKFDRVNKESNMIIDWKTGKQKFGGMSNDIQSIIYYNSYRNIFGSYPQLIYVYLKDSKLVPYNPDETYTKIVYDEIIPELIDAVLAGNYAHTGLFTNACRYCSFKRFCYGELGIE